MDCHSHIIVSDNYIINNIIKVCSKVFGRLLCHLEFTIVVDPSCRCSQIFPNEFYVIRLIDCTDCFSLKSHLSFEEYDSFSKK